MTTPGPPRLGKALILHSRWQGEKEIKSFSSFPLWWQKGLGVNCANMLRSMWARIFSR